jgi:hypothetical protein
MNESIITKPVTLFFSYAREDVERVFELYRELSNQGFRPWMDTQDIVPGENWKRALWRAIRSADFFIFFASHHSVGKRGFVQKELKEALEIWKEKLEDDIYLIPVRLEECTVPTTLSDLQYVDAFAPGGRERLAAAIRVGISRYWSSDGKAGATAQIIKKERAEEDSDSLYSFTADYPQIFPAADIHLERVNSRLAKFVSETLTEFKALANATDRMDHKREMHLQGRPTAVDSLSISSSVVRFDEELLSVRFQLASYGAGAAHPNSNTRTMTFDLKSGTELALADLFQENSNYLNVLSDLCRTDLSKQKKLRWTEDSYESIQDQMLISGLEPVTRNFQAFLFMHGGLKIIFDPYHVGSYAEGEYEVFIPADDMKGILTDEMLKKMSKT